MDRITVYVDGRQYTYWVRKVTPGDPALYEIISEEEYAKLSAENERGLDGGPEGQEQAG